MDENVTVTLTLDEAVKNLIQLTALDIMLCKAILRGENVDNNLGMLGVNNKSHNLIYDQIAETIGASTYSEAYLIYRVTLQNFLITIDNKLNGESDEA